MRDAMSVVEFVSTKWLEISIYRLVGRSRLVHGTYTNLFPTSVRKEIVMISLIQFTIWRSKVSLFLFLRLSVLKTGLGDDEYDYWKAEAGNAMRDRMGLGDNPLDGVVARVCTPHIVSVFLFY